MSTKQATNNTQYREQEDQLRKTNVFEGAQKPYYMITCEECGEPVDTHNDGSSGVIIEYYNCVPEYSEEYGFCADHRPSDIEGTKWRIKQGLDPIPDDEDPC